VSGLLDAGLEWAVASFAVWTVLYHLALTGLLPAGGALGAWVLVSVAVAVVRVRLRSRLRLGVPAAGTGVALAVAAAFAVISVVVVRPDLDDASYTVRSTWVAARGRFPAGDVIFTDDVWPGLVGQTPYLPSVESLLGLLARVTGLAAGDVVYRVLVPVASFAAVWALWGLLRAWGARRPAPALVLACVFLLWSAWGNAAWGNLHLVRIWQGKITFLAVVVPLAYCWAARYWSATTASGRRTALVLLGAVGVVGVGLTPAAVFVVPGIMAVASVAGLVTRRLPAALALVAVGSAYPLGAGVVTLLQGASESFALGVPEDPWAKTLGTGVPFALVVVAAVAALAGVVVPRVLGTCAPHGRVTAAVSVVAGLAIATPALYGLAVGVLGTNAIAWRLTWVVPVPALVGLLACLPRGPVPVVRDLVPVAVGVGLVVSGTPVWSPANGAGVAGPGEWKLPAADLATARWIVAASPDDLYLARAGVVAAVGTLSAEQHPVGSRSDYLVQYADLPAAHAAERTVLQAWADGTAAPADLERVPAALDGLAVGVVCLPRAAPVLLGPAWTEQYASDADVCWVR
jgi:hypothetical protein